MIYLDTGCLVKLYYPEPNSLEVMALVQGQQIAYTPLHDLELTNALALKIFFKTASSAQVAAAKGLLAKDRMNGVLVSPGGIWRDIFLEATQLAEFHTPSIGCRSLDILHCATAKLLSATEFVTTDIRQKTLANAMGLKLATI